MTDSGKKWLPGMYKTFLTRRLRRMSHHCGDRHHATAGQERRRCEVLAVRADRRREAVLAGSLVADLPVVDELDSEVEFLAFEQGDDRL
jgi:hypothetical protein